MNNRTVLIVCLTVLTIFTIGTGLVLSSLPDHGVSGESAIGTLMTTVGPVITTLILLMRQQEVKATAEEVKATAKEVKATAEDTHTVAQQAKSNTDKILNGEFEAKMTRVVSSVARGVIADMVQNPPTTNVDKSSGT